MSTSKMAEWARELEHQCLPGSDAKVLFSAAADLYEAALSADGADKRALQMRACRRFMKARKEFEARTWHDRNAAYYQSEIALWDARQQFLESL